MSGVDLVEAREVERLPAEQLDGRHAGDIFLKERVDARDPAPHDAVRIAHVAPEPLGDERNQRKHREGHESQPPVHAQHDRHDPDQREDVPEDRDHSGREQVVQHVHV
jgi:hypothetical protein